MIIVITGGIGSGKSMVSAILKTLGYPVYDCDSQAMHLMHNDIQLKQDIIGLLGGMAYDSDGRYNREWVSQQVFADSKLLRQLNALVHPAVRRDIQRWADAQANKLVFVETALLRQSGMIDTVDAVWRVLAPDKLRLQRVGQRSNLAAEEILARMKAQNTTEAPYDHEQTLCNDGIQPLLPQVIALLQDVMQPKKS